MDHVSELRKTILQTEEIIGSYDKNIMVKYSELVKSNVEEYIKKYTNNITTITIGG